MTQYNDDIQSSQQQEAQEANSEDSGQYTRHPETRKTDTGQSGPKSKLKALGVAFGLGIAGYSASILWTIPFREVTRLPWLSPSTATQLIMNNIALVLGAVTIGTIYLRVSGKGIDYVDFHIPDKRTLALIIGGTLTLLLAFFAIGAGTSFFEGAEASEHSIQQTVSSGNLDPQFLLVMIPISFLVIGPSEEFVFRNLVQKRLYEDFSTGASVVLASGIFAFTHLPTYATGPASGVIISLGSVFVFSIILGTVYAWSENLLIPAVIHGSYNAIIFTNWYTALAHGFTFL